MPRWVNIRNPTPNETQSIGPSNPSWAPDFLLALQQRNSIYSVATKLILYTPQAGYSILARYVPCVLHSRSSWQGTNKFIFPILHKLDYPYFQYLPILTSHPLPQKKRKNLHSLPIPPCCASPRTTPRLPVAPWDAAHSAAHPWLLPRRPGTARPNRPNRPARRVLPGPRATWGPPGGGSGWCAENIRRSAELVGVLSTNVFSGKFCQTSAMNGWWRTTQRISTNIE